MSSWDEEVESWLQQEPYPDEPLTEGQGRIVPAWVFRIGAVLLLVVFLASSFLFLLEPARFNRDPEPAFDPEQYSQWVQGQASAVVGQSRVMAFTFAGGLEDHPVLALAVPVGSPNVVLRRMQDESLRLFGRIFTDSRADTAYVLWLAPYAQTTGQQAPRVLQVILSRERAESINWSTVLPGDLPEIADDYIGADLASFPAIVAS